MSDLLPVAEALARILAMAPTPLDSESVPLARAAGRTLARPVVARRAQPPFACSAMDGYAVRAADLAGGAPLRVVGVSAAGHGFTGHVGVGEACRIFTGAPVPAGADTVLIQENAAVAGTTIQPSAAEPVGRHIRAAGLDFAVGETGLAAGRRLGPSELALAAAMDHPTLDVVRRPRVALLATGDELRLPGEARSADQIVASNGYALAAATLAAGGEPIDLGIAADTLEALASAFASARAQGADVLVTLGGASVGDHDLVRRALVEAGMHLDFWQIAMRPGKPMMSGMLGPVRVIGLPGNPVSSIVCGTLFVQPLIRALLGDPFAGEDTSEPAILGAALPENDRRQDYLRATLARDATGRLVATAGRRQDSSMLRVLADAQGLVVRPPFASAASVGDPCRVIRLDRA